MGVIINSFNFCFAQDYYVNGYTKKDGTYVQGHYKTTPNSNMFDNFSTKGNINPYTGKSGYVDPYKSNYNSRPQQRNYYQYQY